jgi:spore germination protein
MTERTTQSRRTPWRLVGVLVSVAIACVALVVVVTADDSAESDGPANRTEQSMPTRIGYVPYWDQRRALDVVWQRSDMFDQVSLVWYSLDPTGHIVPTDDRYTHINPQAVRAMHARGIQVIPTVTSLRNGRWNADIVQQMLHDAAARRTHIRELVQLAVTKGYDGIDIDYESLSSEDRAVYSRFLTKLGAALHAEGKLLTTAVHPKVSNAGYDERNLAQDYRAIGAAVDQVRVMTYDYSWDTSPPGPVAPAAWVEKVIAWTVRQIPREKVILGIDLLGYDWSGGRGVTVDHEQAQALADAHGVTIRRSADGSPSFIYRDSSGDRHEVWWEDARSARTKLALVSEYGLGGVFFWRLGGEDSNVWPTARTALEDDSTTRRSATKGGSE